MPAGYVPLQVLGHHSLLRGTFSPEELARAAAAMGLEAVALTDRNGLMGAVPFVKACRKEGVRPLLGTDLEKDGLRLTVLARDRVGFAACCRLASGVNLEPEYDLLGEVARRADRLVVLCGDPERLPGVHGALGGEGLYAAVARLPGRRPARLLRVAGRLGVPAVAVGDVHLLRREDHVLHRVMRAVARGTVVQRLDPAEVVPREAYLCSPQEMAARHAGEEHLLAATVEVAHRCRVDLELGRPVFPATRLPEGEHAAGWLRRLTLQGAAARYGHPLPEGVRVRLEHELEVIGKLGYADYFLIVREILEFARSRDIPFLGRGSAADSLVVYCLGFTRVDPLAHDLVFERFLSSSRRSLPDIDVDFCWRRRGEVIDFVYRRFGRDRVATICTHATLRFRSAFREAAKALGLPGGRISRVADSLPHDHEGGLARALEVFPECREAGRDPQVRFALALADRLRGRPRHLGMHPGGMVIADRPLTWYTPVVRSAKGPLVTQMEMRAVEALGLVKMDLLGQRSLTTIREALHMLEESGEGRPDLEGLPEEDPGIRDLMLQSRTIGCFQVESPAMRKLLVEMQARTRRDVIDAVALIRPGPAGSGMKERYVRRRQGLEPVTCPHPDLEEVLGRSLGVMLYQEDVLRVCARMAGWPLESGDLVRNALGKMRDPALLDELRARYLRDTVGRGVPEEAAADVWRMVGGFAAFSFCKAHAASYGQLAFEELCLKSRHPAAFFCAVLNNGRGHYPDRVYLEEARRMGVAFLLPDINRSGSGFRLERGRIRIGLARVRGLGHATVERILRERAGNGPFFSLGDFMDRTRPGRDEARNLVLCGAFDGLDRLRPELLWQLQLWEPREDADGERLFREPERTLMLPRLKDYPGPHKRRLEYAVLGMTAEGGAAVFGSGPEGVPTVPAAELPRHVGRTVTCFGWCSATRRTRTTGGRYMRFLTLEDPTGTIEGVLFPEANLELGPRLRGEGPYLIDGRVEADLGAVTVHVTDLRRLPEDGEEP